MKKIILNIVLITSISFGSIIEAYSSDNINPTINYTDNKGYGRNYTHSTENPEGKFFGQSYAFLYRAIGKNLSYIDNLRDSYSIKNIKDKKIKTKDKNEYNLFTLNYRDNTTYGILIEPYKEIDIYKNNICVGYNLLEPVYIEFPDTDPFMIEVKKLKENKKYLNDIIEIKKEDKDKISFLTYEKKFSGYTERYFFIKLNQKFGEQLYLISEMFYPSSLEDEILEMSKKKLKKFVKNAIYYRDYRNGKYNYLNIDFMNFILDKKNGKNKSDNENESDNDDD